MKTVMVVCLLGMFLGCAHCSRTVTHFDGKTKSLNPYGDGNMTIDRESYWGNMNCVRRMLDEKD